MHTAEQLVAPDADTETPEHEVHTSIEDAPATEEYEPAAHGVQDIPVDEEYLPGWQGEQIPEEES